MKRGQLLGFGALALTLATIVALTALGQPWVAGVVTTTGLPAIVAIFVTGEYRPPPDHIREAVPSEPAVPPHPELPGVPSPPDAAIE